MSLRHARYCPNCKADLRSSEIPAANLHLYNHGPNGELIHSAEEYAKVRDQVENETTHFRRVIGVEYGYDSPERYDGVSEWVCPDCRYREGRWTGKALAPNEIEPRWGRDNKPIVVRPEVKEAA